MILSRNIMPNLASVLVATGLVMSAGNVYASSIVSVQAC